MGVGYNDAGVQIDSWGMIGTLTFDAIAKLCVESNGGELYVLLSEDQIAKSATKAPNGIDWDSLVSDFDQLGGKLPIPSPPAPAPTSVTLAQAQAWATSGLASNWPK